MLTNSLFEKADKEDLVSWVVEDRPFYGRYGTVHYRWERPRPEITSSPPMEFSEDDRRCLAGMESLFSNLIRHQEMFTTITFAPTHNLERGIQIYNLTGIIQFTSDMDGTDQIRIFLDVVERIESLKELPDIRSMKNQKIGYGTFGALGTAVGLGTVMYTGRTVGDYSRRSGGILCRRIFW